MLVACGEMYFQGVSTRNVRDVLESMCDGELSAMTVSRVAAELDEKLASFRSRRLDHASWPYLMLDARYEKVRVDGRVVSQAVLVVVGFTCGGRREVLDWRVSDGETEQAWGGVPVAEGPGAFGRHAGRLRRPPRDPPPSPATSRGGVAAVPGAPEAGAGQQAPWRPRKELMKDLAAVFEPWSGPSACARGGGRRQVGAAEVPRPRRRCGRGWRTAWRCCRSRSTTGGGWPAPTCWRTS